MSKACVCLWAEASKCDVYLCSAAFCSRKNSYMQPLEALFSTYLKSPHDVKSITKAIRTFKNFLSIGNFSSLYETI